MTPSNIVQKLWNYCNVLRDAGMRYGDYPRFHEDRLEAAPVLPCTCGIRTSPFFTHDVSAVFQDVG